MSPRVFSRIDHVVMEAEDEQALFDFFHERLGMPIAWPMAQWGPVHEGGVHVGNCNIGCTHKLDPQSPDEPRIAAVAFEPYGGVEASLEVLDSMGLAHSGPMPSGVIELPYSPWNAGWTNAMLLEPTPVSFLCEYDHDVAQRRHGEARAFAASPNPVGIRRLVATWSNTTEYPTWQSLLEHGLGEGPYFNFDDSIGAGVDLNYYWGLTFEVASLDRAARALDELGVSFGEVFSGDGRRSWLDSLQLSEDGPFGELYIAFISSESQRRSLTPL